MKEAKDYDKYYDCKDCLQCEYNYLTGKYCCRRTYLDVSPESSACDDFELDKDHKREKEMLKREQLIQALEKRQRNTN